MELNGDGHLDILSGSYSRQDKDMAGLFQVLWGTADGGFRAPEPLLGTDGQPLVITPTQGGEDNDGVIQKICTRPTAVDLDGDGKLDIVAGNFAGTFAVFHGEGGGKFAPQNTWLEGLRVEMHSDPFFVDWDGDGDLDLVTGSSAGGVFLFANTGTKTAPKFGAKQTLLAAAGHGGMPNADEMKFGDAHIEGPSGATRVWVADVNGDGKLDLLVGDSAMIFRLQPGVAEAAARKGIAELDAKQTKLFEGRGDSQPSEADQEKLSNAFEALQKEREKLVADEMTGFVWVLYQK